jgi:hypothetical protein
MNASFIRGSVWFVCVVSCFARSEAQLIPSGNLIQPSNIDVGGWSRKPIDCPRPPQDCRPRPSRPRDCWSGRRDCWNGRDRWRNDCYGYWPQWYSYPWYGSWPYFYGYDLSTLGWFVSIPYYDADPVEITYTPADLPVRAPVARPERVTVYSQIVPLHKRQLLLPAPAQQPTAGSVSWLAEQDNN